MSIDSVLLIGAVVITILVAWFLTRNSKVKLEEYPCDVSIQSQLDNQSQEVKEGQISGIWIYPLKSCKAVKLPTWYINREGLRYDRRWLFVDSENVSKTIRDYPELLAVTPSIKDGKLVLDAPRMPTLKLPLERKYELSEVELVRHQAHKGTAVDEGVEASAWISRYISKPGLKLRIFRYVDVDPRRTLGSIERLNLPLETTSVKSYDYSAFWDKTPFMAISEESYNDFVEKMKTISPGEQVPLEDFRPNLVFKGVDKAFSEDTFAEFRIGETLFRGVLPCTRCKVTQVNAQTFQSRESKEPLTTLLSYRNIRGKGALGHHLNHLVKSSEASIKVGDPIYVRKRKVFPSPFPDGDLGN